MIDKLMTWKRSIPWLQSRVPERFIFPLFSICLGNRDGGSIDFYKTNTGSLFYNGAIFVRVMFPFFIGIGIRWAGKDINKREFLQTYIGIKLNGEWALMPRFRRQSDVSAAKGTTGPNYGQAIGWNAGTK